MNFDLRSNRDAIAGLPFIVIGVIAFILARDYPFGVTARMGPGYFPMALGGILTLFGIYILARGIRAGEPVRGRWAWKPLALITLSIVLFGFLMERFGIILALVAVFFLSAFAGADQPRIHDRDRVHLSMELFKSMTGASFNHIPYKGSAGVLADVMAGQISLTMDNIPVYLPQVQAGRIRALGVSSVRRTPAAPEIPTVAEAGVPGLEAVTWFGLFAPVNAPKLIVGKLSEETARILKLPDVNKRISELGAEPVGSTPQQYAAFIQSEIVKWRKVIREAGVRLE